MTNELSTTTCEKVKRENLADRVFLGKQWSQKPTSGLSSSLDRYAFVHFGPEKPKSLPL